MTRYPASMAASLLLGTVLGGVLGKPWGVEAIEYEDGVSAPSSWDEGDREEGQPLRGDEKHRENTEALAQDAPGAEWRVSPESRGVFQAHGQALPTAVPLQPWDGGAAGMDPQGVVACQPMRHDGESGPLLQQGFRPDSQRLEPVSSPVAAVPSVLKWIKTTAYCPGECCCEGSADGITATGVQVARQPYGGASAWDRLQPGTRFKAPGYDPGHTGGWYEIDDSGSAMRRSSRRGVTHLDLRFRTHYWARKWGTRWLWVEVRP